jgi:septation ring formation regulator EzrA
MGDVLAKAIQARTKEVDSQIQKSFEETASRIKRLSDDSAKSIDEATDKLRNVKATFDKELQAFKTKTVAGIVAATAAIVIGAVIAIPNILETRYKTLSKDLAEAESNMGKLTSEIETKRAALSAISDQLQAANAISRIEASEKLIKTLEDRIKACEQPRGRNPGK